MSATFYDEVQELRRATPTRSRRCCPRSSSRRSGHGGWLPEEAFREVADALELTPAYCLSIASFYDMFHTEPVGRHVVEVCTNVSCALSGAQDVVEAFERELGITSARRPRTAPSRCARSSASAAAAGRPSSPSTTATGCTCRAADVAGIVEELAE